MNRTAELCPVRPRLAFRVGVTGTRRLPEGALPRVQAQVRAVLELVRDEVAAAGQRPEARAVYAEGHLGPLRPWLRVLSPLAKGADQLGARTALDLGFELAVALPFAQDDYERTSKDEPGSIGEFRNLLLRASDGADASSPRIVTLDGSCGEDAALSYQAVSRLVVRNCDLLVAIWDGGAGRGAGGTADTVGFAAAFGQPVWWIDPAGAREPILIEAASHLRWRERARQGAAAADALRDRIRRLTVPPGAHHSHGHGVLGRMAAARPGPRATGPLQEFLQERTQAPGWFGRVFAASGDCVLRAAAWAGRVRDRRLRQPDESGAAPRPPLGADPVGTAWDAAYAAPNALASAYAARYRSTYTLVVLLAALALLLATAALDAKGFGKPALTLAELVLLAAIAGLVVVSGRRRWHERWIAYRLVAELCRKQGALALLGWALPDWSGGRAAGADDPADEGGHALWAGWYVDAVARALPLPRGALSGPRLDAVRDRVLHTLLDEQRAYHLDRARRCRAASRGLAGMGEALFFATVALVAVKMLLLVLHAAPGTAQALGQAAVLLATPSAAFAALRAYAELDLLAEQSGTMANLLGAAEARIRDMPADRPLVSQEIGREVAELADAMLHDVEGWARLFQ